MPEFMIQEFQGLDVRRLVEDADPRTLRTAKNVRVTRGKGIQTRPGTRITADLDPDSVGLYSAGGSLRSAAPAGYSDLFNAQPPAVKYDFLGDGSAIYLRDSLARVISSESVGATNKSSVRPFLLIERADGTYEMHYIDVEPDTANDFPKTLVDVPFVVTRGGLVKLASKLWVPAAINGAVQFSSTQFGPRDWEALNDAGYLPVTHNTQGDQDPIGVGIFQNRLVVAFADSLQVWAVDPDPVNHFLVDTFNGPGTNAPGTMVNVLGDMVFFSRGGFRSLSQVSTTGQLREGDIGAPIFDITETLDDDGAKSLWSQSLGAMLTILDGRLFVYSLFPTSQSLGWTEWTFPFTPVDMVEHRGSVYIRDADHQVHVLDPTLDTDDGVQFEWEVQTQSLTMGRPNLAKLFQTISLVQDGRARVSFLGYDGIETVGPTVTGATRHFTKIPIGIMTEGLSVKFTGTGSWRLDRISLTFQQAGR